MPKKFKKGTGKRVGRPIGDDTGAEKPVVAADVDVEPPSPPARPPGASAPDSPAAAGRPLPPAQELELEVGLAVLGLMVGGLTGYSQVPLGAVSGNVPDAAAGGALGAVLGLAVAKSLFLTMRDQWLAWAVLAAASWTGYHFAQFWGAAVAALLVFVLVLRPLEKAEYKSESDLMSMLSVGKPTGEKERDEGP